MKINYRIATNDFSVQLQDIDTGLVFGLIVWAKNNTGVEVIRVWIEPKHRGIGLGFIMMREMIKATRKYQTVTIDAFPEKNGSLNMAKLICFYHRFGFNVSHTSAEGMIMKRKNKTGFINIWLRNGNK